MKTEDKAKIKSFLEFFFCGRTNEWESRSEKVLKVIHDPQRFDSLITKMISEFEKIAETNED